MEKKKVDPILVSVLDSRFSSIADEMARSMTRSSMSPIFFEARDCCTALFTGDLRLLAMKDFVPILVFALPVAVKHIAKAYESDINEGDIFIHNDAYDGGNHLPDTTIAKPIFYKGELVFWATTKGHLADIGGRGIVGYDPTATTIWDDGLVIPASKLYIGGKPNRSVWDLIERNSKTPDLVVGDIACEVGSVTLAERRLTELLERYGVETINAAMDEIISATEREVRDRVRQIPDGVYREEKLLDPEPIKRDKPVALRVKITVWGDEMTLDYSESDDQVAGYMNSSWANTVSATYLAVFYALPGGDVKRNEGALRPIHIIAREGSVFNPRFPAPVTLCSCATAECLIELVWRALSQAIPQWVTAGSGKINQDSIIGFNPRTKRQFAGIDFLDDQLGAGATEGYDAWPTAGMANGLGQLALPDYEVTELVWPMRILQSEQIKDTLGAGKFCGSPAHIYRAQYLTDVSCVVFGCGMRDYSSPFGLFGGGNAKPNRITLYRADGKVEDIDVNVVFQYKPGDIKERYLQEGGGFGDPWEREPERVRDDVYNELVSMEKAREVYGVVIDPVSLEVDVEATKELREKRKKK